MEKAKLKDRILKELDQKIRVSFDISELCDILEEDYNACFSACNELEDDGHIESNIHRQSSQYPDNKMVWILPQGKDFIKNNSYESIVLLEIKEFQKVQRIEIKEEKKLDWELQLAEWQVKTFWWWLILAVTGGICGIISLILELY